MVREIRIYVEGGGDGKDQKAKLRESFSDFFYKALGERIPIIPCGGRGHTYRDFQNALAGHPDAFNILLVDSEGPVNSPPWQHLHNRPQDNWERPAGVMDEQCHLMVQMMEAWFVADIETLKEFYKQGFNPNPFPKNPNVEEISKELLEEALKTATQNTTKGEYRKIEHGSKILARIDPAKVRVRAAHCDRLLNLLSNKINAINRPR